MSHQMVNLPQFSLYVIFVFKSWLLHWIFECWIPVKKSLSHWRAKGQDWTPETIPTKISLRRIHSARITFETQWKYSNQRRQYSKKKNPATFLYWSLFPALSRRFKHVCCSLVVICIWNSGTNWDPNSTSVMWKGLSLTEHDWTTMFNEVSCLNNDASHQIFPISHPVTQQ